jgi:Peptidase family M28
MKNRLKIAQLTLVLLLAAVDTMAQNQLPVLQHVKAVVDTVQRQVTITYDLTDDDETVMVSVQLVDADGHRATLTEAQGDLGYQTSGTTKRIVGHYTDATWLHHKGTVRLVANDRQKAAVSDLLATVDTNRIKQNTKLVYGLRDHETKAGVQHLAEVRQLVAEQFQSRRFSTARTPFSWQKHTGENVVGTKEGVGEQTKTYVIGAHMDAAKGSPGGDDNATGVAGLLEVMHALSAYEFRHRIVLVGFDLEEIGFMGSQFFVKEAARRKETIAGMINYDMIGTYSERPKTQFIPPGFDALFPDVAEMVAKNDYRGNFLICTANTSSEALGRAFRESAKQYVPALTVASLVALENGEMTPTLAASDHASFWKAGIQALHIGDGGETRNQKLNTPADNLDGLSYRFVGQTVKATLATIAQLAQLQHCAVATVEVSFSQSTN